MYWFAAGHWRNQESREALALSIGQAHRADWPIDDPDREPRVVTGDDDPASRTLDLPVLEVPAHPEHRLRGIVPVRRDPREEPGDLSPRQCSRKGVSLDGQSAFPIVAAEAEKVEQLEERPGHGPRSEGFVPFRPTEE